MPMLLGILFLLAGRSQGLGDRPACLSNAVVQQARVQASPFCPFANRQGLSLVYHPNRPGLVTTLLLGGGPADIPRFVVAIVVDAVQASVGRPRTDSGEERLEALPPCVAHLNAPCPVPVVVWVGGVVAAAFGDCPCAVDTGATGAVSSPVLPSRFALEATTTSDFSLQQSPRPYGVCIPTITQTYPRCFVIQTDCTGLYDQSPKASSRQVDDTHRCAV